MDLLGLLYHTTAGTDPEKLRRVAGSCRVQVGSFIYHDHYLGSEGLTECWHIACIVCEAYM